MAPVILLTRPAEDATALAGRIRAARPEARVLVSPLQRIDDLPVPPEAFARADGLIFTSRNGVRAWQRAGAPVRPCYCVGDATAALARAAGLDAISAEGNADALVARMQADAPGGRWLHLRGEHARGAVAGRLTTKGVRASEVVAYRQAAQELDDTARAALAGPARVIVPLYSPRSARLFAAAGPFGAALYVAAMSAEVTAALGPMVTCRCEVVGHPDGEHMFLATLRLFAEAQRVEGGQGAE